MNISDIYDTAKNARDKKIEKYKHDVSKKICDVAERGHFSAFVNIDDIDYKAIYKELKKYFKKQGFRIKNATSFTTKYMCMKISWNNKKRHKNEKL